MGRQFYQCQSQVCFADNMSNFRSCLRVCNRGLRLLNGIRARRIVLPFAPLTNHPLLLSRSLSAQSNYVSSYKHYNTSSTDSTSSAPPLVRPKAVIFDLGGVVVPSPQPIFDRFEDEHHLKRGSLVATIKTKGDDGAFAKMEKGVLTVEGFVEPFTRDYEEVTGVAISKELVQEFIKQLADFTKLTPNQAVLNMFQRLQSQGIKVAILTNNFVYDNGHTVFPKRHFENVDVVSGCGMGGGIQLCIH